MHKRIFNVISLLLFFSMAKPSFALSCVTPLPYLFFTITIVFPIITFFLSPIFFYFLSILMLARNSFPLLQIKSRILINFLIAIIISSVSFSGLSAGNALGAHFESNSYFTDQISYMFDYYIIVPVLLYLLLSALLVRYSVSQQTANLKGLKTLIFLTMILTPIAATLIIGYSPNIINKYIFSNINKQVYAVEEIPTPKVVVNSPGTCPAISNKFWKIETMKTAVGIFVALYASKSLRKQLEKA